jgi:hypothetical protein
VKSLTRCLSTLHGQGSAREFASLCTYSPPFTGLFQAQTPGCARYPFPSGFSRHGSLARNWRSAFANAMQRFSAIGFFAENHLAWDQPPAGTRLMADATLVTQLLAFPVMDIGLG